MASNTACSHLPCVLFFSLVTYCVSPVADFFFFFPSVDGTEKATSTTVETPFYELWSLGFFFWFITKGQIRTTETPKTEQFLKSPISFFFFFFRFTRAGAIRWSGSMSRGLIGFFFHGHACF